ncbi:MAG: GTP 3',8-cyclase MoaA [Dethiobacter sp.]|nr:MAG: GTP 3',8-cyclase MoaA [Dethiobacter sp.]
MLQKFTDSYGREVNYLRLSVTEQCNLSCFYCRSTPGECGKETGKELLTVENCLTIGQVAVDLGITRIRLTGGEPLLRPDILDITGGLAAIPGLKDLSLTTNGILLEKIAFKLAAAGLKRVNISLDSLDEANFHQITNGGKLQSTLQGIEHSLQAGLTPVKINVVLLKGINDHEIEKFVAMTMEKELDVRFIEYMPTQGQKKWSHLFLPLQRVLEIAEKIAPLVTVDGEHGGGPAQYFRLEGAVGKIGLISPLSRHFCDRCNRLRVTSDGKIKPCLFSDDEIDLRPYFSAKEQLRAKFFEALQVKPDPRKVACSPVDRVRQFQGKRSMTQIGG